MNGGVRQRCPLRDRRGFSLLQTSMALAAMLLAAAILITAVIATVRVICEDDGQNVDQLGESVYRLLHDALLFSDEIALAQLPTENLAAAGTAPVQDSEDEKIAALLADYNRYSVEQGLLLLNGQEVYDAEAYRGCRLRASASVRPTEPLCVELEVQLLRQGREAFSRRGAIYLQNCEQLQELRPPDHSELEQLYFLTY